MRRLASFSSAPGLEEPAFEAAFLRCSVLDGSCHQHSVCGGLTVTLHGLPSRLRPAHLGTPPTPPVVRRLEQRKKAATEPVEQPAIRADEPAARVVLQLDLAPQPRARQQPAWGALRQRRVIIRSRYGHGSGVSFYASLHRPPFSVAGRSEQKRAPWPDPSGSPGPEGLPPEDRVSVL